MRKFTLAAVATVLLAGCGGPSADEGGNEDKKDIVVGVIADLTGATADVGKPYNEGMLAYVDNLNAKGGVDGRKIKALSEDYQYKVPTAEEKYKKFVAEGAVAIQGASQVAPYVVLVLILLLRPYGLFGQPRIERV